MAGKAGKAPRVDGTTGNDVLLGVDTLINIIYGGAGDDIITGGSQDDVLVGDAGNDTLYGAAGNDSIWGGGSDDKLFGGAGVDQLFGDGGNDFLDGGAGADIMSGGTGNDTYRADDASDVIIEKLGEGIDTVLASASYVLSANIENLILTGSANISGTGNDLKNALTGNSGDNFLDGGVGADTMTGGLGNDTYAVDNATDAVIEKLGEGTDLVQASVSFVLGANAENLTLTGAANLSGTGNELNNVITGNGGDNQLFGGAGNDALSGGAGADVMTGGAGNDTYAVDNASDAIVENLSEGVDLVQAAISYVLGANLENLTLTGLANLSGTGNALNNVITGNSGDNDIDGGVGADMMAGGAGNDTYFVDNAGDLAAEKLSEGIDRAVASVSYTLSGNVENLTLTGLANLSGTGNALNNMIIGNSGDNLLDGAAGADTMTGGLGNDTYVIDNAGDAVTEKLAEGTDLVQSSINYLLGSNVENLNLTGLANLSGAGNELNNIINGNVGNNLLTGGDGNDTVYGGDGNDALYGGNGNDGLNGGAGADTIYGGVGNDGIFGGGANDTIYGGDGVDRIYGDGGNDLIYSGAGSDMLAGGQFTGGFSLGNDTFLWARADVVNAAGVNQGFDHIIDFSLGDVLNFSGLGLGAGVASALLKVTDTATGTIVSANFGGSIGYVDVVQLDNVHKVTLVSLLNDHAIIL